MAPFPGKEGSWAVKHSSDTGEGKKEKQNQKQKKTPPRSWLLAGDWWGKHGRSPGSGNGFQGQGRRRNKANSAPREHSSRSSDQGDNLCLNSCRVLEEVEFPYWL